MGSLQPAVSLQAKGQRPYSAGSLRRSQNRLSLVAITARELRQRYATQRP